MQNKRQIIDASLLAVSRAFSEFSKNFKRGKTIEELFLPFRKSLKAALGEFEILYDYIWGKDTLNIDGVTDGAYIPKDGDSVIMDISILKDGVWCDVCRTYFVGEPSPEQMHMFELIKDSIKAGEKELYSGNLTGNVYRTVNSVYEKDGKTLIHHAGHSIKNAAVDEPRFTEGNTEIIEGGTFYTIETGHYENFGIRLENDYFVGEDLCENLFEKLMKLDIKEYIL